MAVRGQSSPEQSEDGAETGRERGQHVRAYERLREELSPAYEALLKNVVAESDDGVRFVVDLRKVMHSIGRMKKEGHLFARLVVRFKYALTGEKKLHRFI